MEGRPSANQRDASEETKSLVTLVLDFQPPELRLTSVV